MKRRILIFLQIALLLMMYVPAAVADSSIVMSLSKTTASGGDTVTASGTTFPESWVPIKVVDEIGNIVLFDTGKADASGNYSIDFVIPSLNPCTLTVVVGEGSNVVSKNLSIVAAISLSLSKTMASPGDTVTASGKTSPESWVPIKAVDEIGNIVLFDTGKADASGNYSIDFVIPSLSPCTLTVVVGEGSNVVSKNLTIVAAISLSLSKTMVLPSDTVTASGKTSPESWVPIKAVDEIGNIVLFDTGKADAEGNYSIDFVVPENASGVLTIVVGEGSNVASQTLTIVTELIPVTGVSIVQNDQTLEKGQTVQLTAAVEPANATNKAVTWTSSDDSIATVSTDGLVTAVGKGTAIITVTTVDGGLTDTIKVTVLPDLLEVSTYEFEYTVPEEVISGVDYKVPVTIKPVTVGDIGYESVRFNVNVTAPEGETLQLLATDTNGIEHDVAAIGYWGPQNGFPIAKDYSATTEFTAIFSGAGKYIISFSLVEMKTGVTLITENVTIDVDPKISMSLSKTTASVGDTVIVSGKTSPGSWVPIKAMDEIGNILLFDTGKADAEGNYSIDFVVPENASGVLTIVVGKGSNVASQTLTIVTELIPVTGVSIVQNDQTLEKGQTVQLTAAVEPANATNKAVTWTSSDDSIATVSTDGLVTAVGKGTAIIAVTTQDGNFTASINVKVTATVAQPKASPTGGSVGAGTKVTLKAATSGADIYYTLDESTPTTGSNKYTEPIVINEPVTIKAIAVKAGMDDSTVMIESYSLAKAIEDTEVEVSESDKDLAITQETLNLGDTIKINVPENVKDATVSVSALMSPPDESGTVTTGALPALNIDATDAAIGKIQVSIPEGATISAPAEWNGTINVPSVKPVDSVKVDPDPGKKVTVNAVIEVGFGDIPLTFSKAVRLVVPGQAGKDAGYYRDGKFYKIPSLPSGAQDEQDWADANIDDGKDGKMDVAQDW
jgi:uncharacterized protein YjdB